MLILIISISIIIVFPIFVCFECNFSQDNVFLEKKFIYSIKLFNFIKIFFGAIELQEEGIAIHLNKKKAIIVLFNDIFSFGKKFEPLKDYHFIKFHSLLKIGKKEQLLLTSQFGYIYSFLSNVLNWVVKNYKPYLNLDNDVCVYQDQDILEFSGEIIIVFNLLMVIFSIIKILGEKLIYAIRKRAKQN